MAAEWRRWVLRDLVRALPCRQFEIKLVTQPTDGTHGRCIKTLMLTPDELISEWRQFGRWSAQRLNVFMRPVGGPVHVLLDLDTPGVLDEVLNMMAFDGILPSLVVETSLDLSRFDAAPLIAFTATKEIDYGTETDGRIPPGCGAYRADQWAYA